MAKHSADHITKRTEICGGKPCIAGTRIRVWDVHVWHNRQGQSPAEIVQRFPQLTVSDVYAALAYYLDHQNDIERQMAEADRRVEEMKAQSGPSLIDELQQRRLADADVPS